MAQSLKGKNIAILATDGFEQSELLDPKQALEESGARTEVVSLKSGKIKGWKDADWTDELKVDRTVSDANADNYDGLLIPGGVISPDKLRQDVNAVRFVQRFFEQGKPVAAICHGPQVLIEADVVDGRDLTSYASVRTDLENAGANWSDEEVVVDQGLVTSRSPKDLPAFIGKMIEEFAEGVHEGQWR